MTKFWIVLIFTLSTYADVHLIATQECPFNNIDYQTVKKIFMKKSTIYEKTPLKVLDNQDCYDKFTIKFMKKNPTKMNIYWTRMIFTGTRKPPKKISEKKLLNLRPPKNTCLLSYTTSDIIKGWKTVHVVP